MIGIAALGDLVDNICYSILASSIFFFVVIHIKSEKDKANVSSFVVELVTEISGDCTRQLLDFNLAHTRDNPKGIRPNMENLTNDLINDSFRVIAPMSKSALFLVHEGHFANRLELMDYYRIQTTRKIQKLLTHIIYLDPELVRILTKIDNCPHFRALSLVRNFNVTNSEMTPWADSFFRYCALIKELNQYAQRKRMYG
jgi:hypothetical protein